MKLIWSAALCALLLACTASSTRPTPETAAQEPGAQEHAALLTAAHGTPMQEGPNAGSGLAGAALQPSLNPTLSLRDAGPAILNPSPAPARQGICTDEPTDKTTTYSFNITSNPQGPELTGHGLTGCKFTWDKKWGPDGGSRVDVREASKHLQADCSLCGLDNPEIALKSCTAGDGSWLCQATAPTSLCDQDAGTTLELVVLPGQFDLSGKFTSTSNYTLACANPDGGSVLGASSIYKCLRGTYDGGSEPALGPYDDTTDIPWKFVPPSDEFLTCVRAARADYCGSGVSHTFAGTRIYLYSKTDSGSVGVNLVPAADGGTVKNPGGHTHPLTPESSKPISFASAATAKTQAPVGVNPLGGPTPGMCAEADWNVNGAIYAAHPRWQTEPNEQIGDARATDCQAEWLGRTRPSNDAGPILFDWSKRHQHKPNMPPRSYCADPAPGVDGGDPLAVDCSLPCDCDAGTACEIPGDPRTPVLHGFSGPMD